MTQENVHKRLLDNLTTGVVLLDHELHLIYLNAAAESLFEISVNKASRSSFGDLIVDGEEDIREILHAMRSNASFTKRKVEFEISHGKRIFVDYSVSPIEHDSEQQALLELSSLEHSQRISREETLHYAHATTRELVRGLAHEIKNPLGGIRGAAQLLAKEVEGEELTDFTNVIIEEADRLHNLVDRLVGSRKPLDIKPINIHEVLERARNLVKAEVAGHGITLSYDYDPSIPPIQGDREQLIQAMLNIIRNAMQSLTSPDVDHELGEIMLRTRIVRNAMIGNQFHRLAVNIEVVDNGPGVPDHLIGGIFYPMISGRPDGSGLGLPISHGIINQHKGMIECDSKPGRTRFSVVLPLPSNACNEQS